MRYLDIAKSYLRQAEARLDDARDALKEENPPYAVRLSQECVELSLKAVLRAVGIDYPKVHDVSDILQNVKGRFPDWFQTEVDFLGESSKILFKKREPSLYGDDEALISPDEVMSVADAQDAVERSEKTFNLCRRLVVDLESFFKRM